MAVVRLKHITRKNDWNFYFYNGVVRVNKGVIELPADNFTRVRRAYLMGFRLTEDGQPISGNRFSEIVAKATVDSQEEQKSEQDSNSGRQPRPENGVRDSEPESGGDTPKRRSRSRVSSRSGEQRERPTPSTGDQGEVPPA